MLRALLDTMIGSKPVDTWFLDLSLTYRTKSYVHVPLTPVVAEVLASFLNRNVVLLGTADAITFLNRRLEPDERSRCFERLFSAHIFMQQRLEVTCTRLDGSSPVQLILECTQACKLEITQKLQPVTVPTLFIPQSKDFPIVDFLLLTPNRVVVLQLTLASALCKLPSKRAYQSFYDTRKYQSLLVNSSLQCFPEGDTLVESLLALTSNPCKVVVVENQLVNAETKGIITNFEYIVVTTTHVSSNEDWQNATKQFPWVKVIDRGSLCKCFPLVARLQEDDSCSDLEIESNFLCASLAS